MTKKQEFKHIRQSTQRLIDKAEGLDVDFKREATNISAEEFVAFANSTSGGALLIGVDETTDSQGKQRGKVVGCKVDDGAKRVILDKALSCTPPIDVVITVENTRRMPFLRVDVPSGSHKPYCTRSGKYSIREDGRKRAILPNQLLDIFLQERAKRFREATDDLVNALGENHEELQDSVRVTISSILQQYMHLGTSPDHIDELEHRVKASLASIEKTAQRTEAYSDDAMNSANDAAWETEGLRKRVPEMHQEIRHLAWKINVILDHLDLEDPEITYERERIRASMQVHFSYLGEHGKHDGSPFDRNEIKSCYEDLVETKHPAHQLARPFEEYISLKDALEWFENGVQRRAESSKSSKTTS